MTLEPDCSLRCIVLETQSFEVATFDLDHPVLKIIQLKNANEHTSLKHILALPRWGQKCILQRIIYLQ